MKDKTIYVGEKHVKLANKLAVAMTKELDKAISPQEATRIAIKEALAKRQESDHQQQQS